jgi:hypothetical protein
MIELLDKNKPLYMNFEKCNNETLIKLHLFFIGNVPICFNRSTIINALNTRNRLLEQKQLSVFLNWLKKHNNNICGIDHSCNSDCDYANNESLSSLVLKSNEDIIKLFEIS